VDNELISRVFGLDLEVKRDSCQRKNCGCVVSKDIGMYDSCLFGCAYCYATTSFERAKANHQAHNPESPSLLI
jgi:DNA repair photolyase